MGVDVPDKKKSVTNPNNKVEPQAADEDKDNKEKNGTE